MKNEDLFKESIKLILNYQGRSIVIELKKYKTLDDIKDKVYDLFYPVKNNISIYLNNKNLEPLVNQPIGYIFSGTSLVNLKVVDEGVNDSPYKLVKRYKEPNVINDVTNVYSRLSFQNIADKTHITLSNEKFLDTGLKKNNLKKKNKENASLLLSRNNLILLKSELSKDNSNHINKKLFNSKSIDNLKIVNFQEKKQKDERKLPPIIQKNNNKKFDIYTQKKINERVLSSKNKNNKSMNNLLYNKCNSCFINKISIYCRLCDTFLCQNCALNNKSPHQKHKNSFININNINNPENINKYKDEILSDFNKSLNFFDSLDKNLETIYENEDNEEEKFSYSDIISKLDEDVQNLVEKAKSMKSSLKEVEFNDQENYDEQKVKEICDKEKQVLNKCDVFGYKSQIQPFFVLNTFERNMAKYFNNYETNNEQRIYIKTQIELLFDNVENEVDGILDEIDKITENINI